MSVLAGLTAIAALTACEPTAADPGTAKGRADGGLSIWISEARPAEAAEGEVTESVRTDALRQLEAAIGGLDCSRLRLVDATRTGDIELRGHVPSAEIIPDLVASAQRLLGDDTRIVGNVIVLPAPHCTVLERAEALGLAQSPEQTNDPLAVGTQTWSDMPRAAHGDRAAFSLQAPSYDAHIYVDYFDSAGTVVHLMPSDFQAENRYWADATITIGGPESDTRLFYDSPLGLDIVLVVATSEPLYGGIRPLVEDGAGYLSWLGGRVRDQREAHADFHGEWAFMLILTEPRG